MLDPGQRNNRVRFERRAAGDKSPSGNVLEHWQALNTCWAAFRPAFGREQLASGQLQATMMGTMTTLAFAETRQILPADRVVFVSGPYRGRVCQIHSIVPTPDAREIEFLLEHGPKT